MHSRGWRNIFVEENRIGDAQCAIAIGKCMNTLVQPLHHQWLKSRANWVI